MSQDDPTTEFLQQLEHGEIGEGFLEELEKLTPEHRAGVIEALFKKLKKTSQTEESE